MMLLIHLMTAIINVQFHIYIFPYRLCRFPHMVKLHFYLESIKTAIIREEIGIIPNSPLNCV